MLKNVHHDHLISYFGAWDEIEEGDLGLCSVLIVTEYCRGGDLLCLLLSEHELGLKLRVRIACEGDSFDIKIAFIHLLMTY